MRRVAGLQELAEDYDALLCDVWGVIHNGVRSFAPAVEALRSFRAGGGHVVLVTNAPRPNPPIRDQLRSLGAGDDAYDAMVTSGDVTRACIAAKPGAKVFHIGPGRDYAFYGGLDVELVDEERAELIGCTGLFDDDVETPEDYRPLLERMAARGVPMVCANPDIVVERGDKLIYCSGALAELYVKLGGEAVLAGKPHAPIYEAARAIVAGLGGRSMLAIGDGLATDIRGAALNGVDALFVTGGIHAADFGPPDQPDAERVKTRLAAEGLPAVAFIPSLVWAGGNGRA